MATCKNVQYDQGPEAAEVFFSLVCRNVPIGTIVSLSSDNSKGPQPPIAIPPTTVQMYPSFVVGINSQVPANYQCKMNYCFTLPAGVNPPPGFSITLEALITAGLEKKALGHV